MKRSPADLANFRANVLEQTPLGQFCGSNRLFRDRYEVLRVIGRGGFGITFLARNVALPGEPLCVIKQLSPKVSHTSALERARKRFEQEARALARLGSHAQIPRLLDYFEVSGEFFLVQEYIRGVTLSKEIRRTGPWSELAVKQFLREILPPLQYIHSNQVIHRDIKPPNIIRCKDDGRLVLIDFGAVKEQVTAIDDSSMRASTTQFVGTVGFAPPEQLATRPVYASDIYAIGITCLYMLSGKPPLEFDYEFATGEVEWQEHVCVSDHFARILGKMIKISPKERYQSADDVLRALNLETHLDNLSECLLYQPRPSLENKEPDTNSYVPPLARTAVAIRDWRTRLQARQARYHQLRDNLTFSHSRPSR
jgi:serine/threonine protein kinase